MTANEWEQAGAEAMGARKQGLLVRLRRCWRWGRGWRATMVPSEWEQAGAVVARLWDQYPDGELFGWRVNGEHIVTFIPNDDYDEQPYGYGRTHVAALIDLGRQWAQDAPASPVTHGTDGNDG